MKLKLLLCVILAGCAKEFLLTGNNGSTWEVRSSKVALAEHVGHTVTATGVVSNATAHNMKEDAKDVVGRLQPSMSKLQLRSQRTPQRHGYRRASLRRSYFGRARSGNSDSSILARIRCLSA